MDNKILMNENMSSEDMLKEISERLKRMEARQIAERRARIITLVVVVLILAALAIILVPKIMALVAAYNQVMQNLGSIDLSAIDPATIQETLEKVNEVDVDGINTIIENLKDVDFAALSTALAKLQGALSSITSIFG